MLVNTHKVDITPVIGVELCGFANREQPSARVLDPLFARYLLISTAGSSLLFIQFDLLGLENGFVERIRSKASGILHLPDINIQLFASHTHSSACTVKLNACGEYNPQYINDLEGKVMDGVKYLSEHPEESEQCDLKWFPGNIQLGINRRRSSSGEEASTIGVLGFQRPDKSFVSLLVNYNMHPVCLRGTGISADYPGELAAILEDRVPGHPSVLFGLGAAGDIDPPAVGVSYEQMQQWAHQLADVVLEKLSEVKHDKGDSAGVAIREEIIIKNRSIHLPVVQLFGYEIDEIADSYLDDEKGLNEFGSNYKRAIELWRTHRKHDLESGELQKRELKISIIDFGPVCLIFINAELFSGLPELIQNALARKESESHKSSQQPGLTGQQILEGKTNLHGATEPANCHPVIISCANGMEGYLPDMQQFKTGGYEAETAKFFYDSLQIKPGILEHLAEETASLLAEA